MIDRIIRLLIIKLTLIYFSKALKNIGKGEGMKATFSIKGLEVRITGMEGEEGRVLKLDEFTVEKEIASEETIMIEETKKVAGSATGNMVKTISPVVELIREVSEQGMALWKKTLEQKEIDAEKAIHDAVEKASGE